MGCVILSSDTHSMMKHSSTTVLLACNSYVAMVTESLDLGRSCCAGLCTNVWQMAISSPKSIPWQRGDVTGER